MTIESMTGYGAGEAKFEASEAVRILVDIRSVNHRHLDVRARAEDIIADALHVAEDVVRKRVRRGRIDLRVRILGSVRPVPRLDEGRAEAALAQLRALRDRIAPEESVPLSLLQTVPELFVQSTELHEGLLPALREATDAACDDLIKMRRREGAALGTELRALLSTARDVQAALEVQVPKLVDAASARLEVRLGRLLGDRELDPMRLAQEVAVLADRSDVREELARVGSHLSQFESALEEEGAKGRRLDFLLQELGREANTIGSKIQDPGVTPLVIGLKGAIEALREQVQNIV